MKMMWKYRYQRNGASLKLVSECVIWKGGGVVEELGKK